MLKLGDSAAAEKYCDEMAEGKGHKHKQNLLHNLLKIYMDPNLE